MSAKGLQIARPISVQGEIPTESHSHALLGCLPKPRRGHNIGGQRCNRVHHSMATTTVKNRGRCAPSASSRTHRGHIIGGDGHKSVHHAGDLHRGAVGAVAPLTGHRQAQLVLGAFHHL